MGNTPLTHSLTHLLTYSLTHLLTYSLTHLLTYSLTHLLTHSLTHSLTYSLTHSLTQGVGIPAVAAVQGRVAAASYICLAGLLAADSSVCFSHPRATPEKGSDLFR
jgi:hypothetical protein